jgi:thrombospondin type 3 repeat protein/calcineurin-like phosphoesterase family protein
MFGILVMTPLLVRFGVNESSNDPHASGHAAQASAASTFTFAAAGDHAASGGNASLANLNQSSVAFYLALGDLDYDQTPSDEAWCAYIKARLPSLGPDFPFELIVGNHEDQDGQNGYVLNHAACLPDRLGSTGTYAVQYYFDYPASSPLIRVIMIPPDMRVENVSYDYTPGSPPYAWLSSAIDDARTRGIPWVAVGMHKVCITTGAKGCEIGTDLMNLLVSKRVDLVLQGHDHNYQRGKQLALNGGCPAVPAASFDADCVVDSGADGVYTKGAGPIFVISGTFGQCCYSVNGADAEAGYFARIDSTSKGFTKYTVGPAHISAEFVRSTGALTDSFSIVRNGDSDGDGFSDAIEVSAGTDPLLACGFDAWPADIDNDGLVDTAELAVLTGNFGKPVPPAPARADIAPNPPDRFVDTGDIGRVTGLFGDSCAP